MIRALPGIALALSIAAFGALCIASITLSRDYVGNWHVQYALPALCGAYAASFVLWRIDRSRFAAVPFFTLLALLAASVIGYAKGFGEYGPSYHQYIVSIEQYMRAHLTHPRAAKPFPDGPAMTPAMLLFLSAHRHPVFHDDPEPASLAPLPESARVLVDGSEIVPPFVVGGVLGGDRAKPVIVLVGLTRDDPAHGVCARTGGEMLVLRRIHPALGGQGCVDDRARAWYAGLIVPELLPRGAHCVELWVR